MLFYVIVQSGGFYCFIVFPSFSGSLFFVYLLPSSFKMPVSLWSWSSKYLQSPRKPLFPPHFAVLGCWFYHTPLSQSLFISLFTSHQTFSMYLCHILRQLLPNLRKPPKICLCQSSPSLPRATHHSVEREIQTN